jgi:acylphosphatase
MDERLRAFVRGDVQGVAFRWFVQREASGLGLRGWVRNRMDGRVEVLAEGDRPALEELTRLLSRGPRMARVESVDSEWGTATGEYPGFRIEHTV